MNPGATPLFLSQDLPHRGQKLVTNLEADLTSLGFGGSKTNKLQLSEAGSGWSWACITNHYLRSCKTKTSVILSRAAPWSTLSGWRLLAVTPSRAPCWRPLNRRGRRARARTQGSGKRSTQIGKKHGNSIQTSALL